MLTAVERTRESVLAAEQAFFDDESAGLSGESLWIPPDQMARYRDAKPRARNIPKETMFSMLQPLAGKRVLEYGCGTGIDSCHLADCGAAVTAFDLSPLSIDAARRRAKMLGVADRIQFDVRAAGQTGYAPASFDIVVGIAILHHLHTELPAIYREVSDALQPGGTACFIEPVANSRVLQALRSVTPVARHATPDERQLHYADFELAKAHGFREVRYQHFYGLSRLSRVFGERVALPLRCIDHTAQRLLPFLRRYYGIAVVFMHKA